MRFCASSDTTTPRFTTSARPARSPDEDTMLDETHEAIRKSVRDFTEREIVPIADALDNAEKPIPDALIRKMADLGYLGVIFPEAHGGLGQDTLALAVVT